MKDNDKELQWDKEYKRLEAKIKNLKDTKKPSESFATVATDHLDNSSSLFRQDRATDSSSLSVNNMVMEM